MIKLLLLVLFAPSLLWAAQLEVENLYDQKSQVPTVLIPLRVKGDLIAAGGQVFDVGVTATNGGDCRVMKDPFLTNIYLLKCAYESSVTLRFKVAKDGQLAELVYGPLEVKMPSANLEIVQPTNPNSADVLAGKQLFNSYCVTCHNPPTLKRNKNAAQIRAAMTHPTNLYGMNGLNSSLSAADLKKLEAYLKSI